MGSKTDQVKGWAKETVGDLTGNKHLKSNGKVDRRVGEVKENVDHAKDGIEDVIDEVKGALHRK
jgi:uncharacterized protein YjbJ (UPF0337 family)